MPTLPDPGFAQLAVQAARGFVAGSSVGQQSRDRRPLFHHSTLRGEVSCEPGARGGRNRKEKESALRSHYTPGAALHDLPGTRTPVMPPTAALYNSHVKYAHFTAPETEARGRKGLV